MNQATLSRVYSPTDISKLVADDRVKREVYVSENIFNLEMDRIFGNTWIYVAHESEIPNPGDFVTTRLGLQPVIVTRHHDGYVHVLHNRCGHRGAIVCNEARGNTGRSFRCGYHGWTFRTNGELLAAPLKNGYPECYNLKNKEFGLVPVKVATYGNTDQFGLAVIADEAKGVVERSSRNGPTTMQRQIGFAEAESA
ncbi:Rieske 2Fe-2S domain-containing protein, partial [Burkholderia multivorans]|uniref:Rieske 2Fe-2S domain-containing protein n=5 Tax=Burkholderia multivorans TaxID=87883 RepID=UPI0028706B4A